MADAVIALPEVTVQAAPKAAMLAPATISRAPQPSDFVATIIANGQRLTAWESVMVRRDFGNGVSVFQFTPAEGGYGASYQGLKLKPGDPVQITLGGQKVFSGFCKIRSGALDAQSHQLVIAGESMTVDLVRSSAVVKPGTYDGSTFEQAARGVMAPHQSSLVMMNPPAIASKPIANLSVQPGESVAEFVSRIAVLRGLFITDDADGNLVAGQGDPGAAAVATLAEGRNIKRLTWHLEDPAACSWNKLNGISQQAGSDTNYPPRDISATATNSTVRSNLYKLFVSEHPGDAQDLAQRVNHEAAVAAWPIVRLGVTVVGWLKPDGSLWWPVQNVSVYSPSAFPTDSALYTLGIQSCTYTQDANGTETTMELVRPDVLTSAPTSGIPDVAPAPALTSTATPDKPDTSVGT